MNIEYSLVPHVFQSFKIVQYFLNFRYLVFFDISNSFLVPLKFDMKRVNYIYICIEFTYTNRLKKKTQQHLTATTSRKIGRYYVHINLVFFDKHFVVAGKYCFTFQIIRMRKLGARTENTRQPKSTLIEIQNSGSGGMLICNFIQVATTGLRRNAAFNNVRNKRNKRRNGEASGQIYAHVPCDRTTQITSI